MNLVERLIKADAKKADELETRVIYSKKLAKILGEERPVPCTIQEIIPKRYKDIMAMAVDKRGNFDASKGFDAEAILLTESVIDPNVKDEKLLQHFGCATPKELVIKLFGNEASAISDEVVDLCTGKSETQREKEEKEVELKN